MESVYLETTFISYLVSRPSRDLLVAAHQQATRDWWLERHENSECYVSQVVLDELAVGNSEEAKSRVAVIGNFPVLEATKEAEILAEAIVFSGAIASHAARDAAHIAIATVNGIDYLWERDVGTGRSCRTCLVNFIGMVSGLGIYVLTRRPFWVICRYDEETKSSHPGHFVIYLVGKEYGRGSQGK